MQQRIKKHPFLAAFDGPDANASTAERAVTITPLQALFALNDPFAHEQAEAFARRLRLAGRDDRDRINLAYQLAFGRLARPEDIRDSLNYLNRIRWALRTQPPPDPEQTCWSSFSRALLGSNEFLFLD
jgi:hypothetical protein